MDTANGNMIKSSPPPSENVLGNMTRREFQGVEDTVPMDAQYQELSEENLDIKNDQLTLYASVPPWEYMMHYTVVAVGQNMKSDANADLRETNRLKHLLITVENLLNELRNLVNSTCCTTPKENEQANKADIEENCVLLSDKMSILLGLHGKFSSKLYVVDPARVDMEHKRCSSVVDAVVQMLCYKDTDDGNLMFDDLPSMPMIKEEGAENEYEGYEENAPIYSTPNQIIQDNEVTLKEQKYLQDFDQTKNKNKLLEDNVCDKTKYRSIGYSQDYCVTEDVYNDIIGRGEPYTCRCERQFLHRNIFESHLDGKCLGKDGEIRKKEVQSQFKNMGDNTFQCLYQGCNKIFSSMLSLNCHHQNDHLRETDCPYKCDKCEKTFFLKLLLNIHYKEIHFDDIKEMCKICGKNVKTPRKLRLHLQRHHKKKSETRDMQQVIKLEAHDVKESGHVDTKLVTGPEPGKIPEQKIKRKRIKPRVMLEPAKVQAPDIPERYPCGKKRYKPVGYYPEYSISKERYMEIISKGKPYICACQKQFVHRHTFERHLYGNCLGEFGENKRQELHAKWRKDNNGVFHCIFPGCTETFKYNLSLYSHHQKEHLEGVECPFKCDQCDKSFFLRSLLNCHVKDTHEKRSSQNSQVCDICGKDVIRNQMKLHMMRHTGEKPFKCSYCEYRGLTNSAVLQHVKHVHEPHKFTLHFCDMCGKDCKTKAHLKEHILTHSDKRTFLCKVCGKYLKNRNSFGRHMVRVHKISHRCNHCGVDYFTLQGLQIHLLKVHNITS